MRHLSTKIYLTILVSLVAVVLVSGVFWRRAANPAPMHQAFEVAGELAALALPPHSSGIEEQAEGVQALAARLDLDLALFDTARRPVASSGPPLPAPPAHREEGGWIYGAARPAWAITLPDGRWLVARPKRRGHRHPALGFIAFLGTIAAVVGLLAWPVVRGITRRLETLQKGVETLGRGDLSTRVAVRGRDEVARLAESFNGAARRIEELVGGHRMLLANASHELRTPLSRIRLGIDLLQQEATSARKQALERDIAELDSLVDEILLMSRLDAVEGLEIREEVDLLAVAAEEGARREQCSVEGEPVLVAGDPRLLLRLVRNLLENAERHGAPPIEVRVASDGGTAVLSVADAGPGIPVPDRDRVFEPFWRGAGRRREDGGSGLGLALVRAIARRHGGEAVVASDSVGAPVSRMVVTLPTGLKRPAS